MNSKKGEIAANRIGRANPHPSDEYRKMFSQAVMSESDKLKNLKLLREK